MTDDAKKKLFRGRDKWEAEGYRSSEYGHWLSGGWRPCPEAGDILKRPTGTIRSLDGNWVINVAEIDDVALPLYEGRMVGQFDFSEKGWLTGKGRAAHWESYQFENKRLSPQFCMSTKDLVRAKDREGAPKAVRGAKVAFMDVTGSTNARTVICNVIPDCPSGHTVGIFSGSERDNGWVLTSVLNSFVFDAAARQRLPGNHLTLFVLNELPICVEREITEHAEILNASAALLFPHIVFAPLWQGRREAGHGWRALWAVTEYERLRLRCILDATVAHIYGLSESDFARILNQCDYHERDLASKDFTRSLDSKAFWRIDKDRAPQLRHTVLSLVAFRELERIGVDNFLALNDGEGWMIPEKLRLADYGLGHDGREKEYQPVASLLGPRFYDWQLAQSVEESWEECARHAELIDKIVPPSSPVEPEAPITTGNVPEDLPVNLFGEPVPTDIFGNPEYPARGRRRR